MKKNILISTLGGSPKTVTEMYQALKFAGISIHEIHLIGTQGSKSVPQEQQESKTPGTTWHEHRCSNASDVLSTKDAIEVSDLIFQTVKTLKERVDVEKIFLDLTGGRKVMSSYLMVCAQLLCTEEDRLYHVEPKDRKGPLVDFKNPSYETYYYPQTSEEITLLEVPFVSLRNLFQSVGMTQENSLTSFLEKSSQSLEKIGFCGLMANGIGHETATLLMDAFRDAPQIKNTLQQIEGIVKQFSAVLRKEKETLEPISLVTLLEKTKEMMKSRITAKVEIEKFPDVYVHANEILLLRVLSIILKNADKHGDAELIKIKVSQVEDTVAVRIIDNGKGMTEHVQKEAFIPFKSYNTGIKGQQVGLPVSKKLMKLWQGNIEIEQSNSQGTTILITLKKIGKL